MNILKRIVQNKNGLFTASLKYRKANLYFFHSSPDTSVEVYSQDQEVVIALGSNVGNRIHNFNVALNLMKKSGINISRHACLYETAPAYVTDQPSFLNSAIRGYTKLGPHDLLKSLKTIEKEIGRRDGIRYGPRPIDLDILFYGNFKIASDVLKVPHERIWERPFVIAPLVDLLGSDIESDTVSCWHSFSETSDGIFRLWDNLGGESLIGKDGMKRVMPVNDYLWDWSQKTSVMGILNLTPDSFSDGGKFNSVESAVSHIRSMITEGADIIDIGAQSTRPNAPRVSSEEELDRLIPVLETVMKMPEIEGKLVSVDTFHSIVAYEAVKNGAHIINDVSGGKMDVDMLTVVADLMVPYISMHMRGEPSSMQTSENLKYKNVCKEVGFELEERVRDAELCGIPAWRMILDPGIGFSKKYEDNLDILIGLESIRREIGRKRFSASHAPVLIGPSRKRFIGEVCGVVDAIDRDPGTVASVTAGVLSGANIVRVHNVRDNLSAVKLCDAVRNRKRLLL